ncbi:hemin-degrading factor [Albibacillus kandeliae]|uniref:hemin-degrading factor n=1 Tax=Albibacillus kandeliae TaxID=2174228 RepID=UPI000D68C7FF|nr:ChuX/HutX family heme-like substrate-binding protein [Albibacillus kandeliae]
MTEMAPPSPVQIREARAADPGLRDRDFCDKLGIREAQLVAAHVGHYATRIDANPDRIMPLVEKLGDVMALTRNESCVIEKVGTYRDYRGGPHASMLLGEEIDMRLFPVHWVTAFAVVKDSDQGPRRSLQVFDAAGDAVHKIHLRDSSDLDAWAALVAELTLPEQEETLTVEARELTEAAKSNPEKLDILRQEWDAMTDTHQFLRLTSKLRMNRLGAYRIAGAPYVQPLALEAVNQMFEAVQARADDGLEIMVFVGNRGCIEIHNGPVHTLKPMGPWQNVLDPGFNLHLRADHIAEVWAVHKPTRRGMATSVEAFDAEGGLIFQAFGRKGGSRDWRPEWNEIVAGLTPLPVTELA